MFANLITIGKWMASDQLTVAEMVDEVLVHFETLDSRRRYMFLEWLYSHSSQVKYSWNIRDGLKAWLESIQDECVGWEYELILKEIAWWKRLDEDSLRKIMTDHFKRSLA